MNAPHTLIPLQATHPGEVIKDELQERGMSQKELAKQLDLKPSLLNEIIKEKRGITASIAVLLEKLWGIKADFWMRFQSQYEIDCARIKERNILQAKNIESWNVIKECVPVRNFKKWGYFTDDLAKDIEQVYSIFAVNSTDELMTAYSHSQSAYYRKSEKLKIDDKHMFAWSSLAIYEAKKQKVAEFDFDTIDALCTELNTLFFTNDCTQERVKRLLNEYGVKMVYVEKLEGTPVDGFCFWSGDHPAIAMTLRHKRIDNFAFTLMHELAHIALHLRNDKNKPFLDLNKKARKVTNDCEQEADAFAQEKLLPNNCSNMVVASFNKIPFSNDGLIMKVSEKCKIHPAIILGRACYTYGFYAYKTKIDKSLN